MAAKSIMDQFGKLVAGLSHLNFLADVFGALSGKEPLADASVLAKGLSGIFGLKDERKIAVLILELEREWDANRNTLMGQATSNPREILTGFFAWHFPKSNSEQRILAWWYGNQFRSFLTEMGSIPGKKDGETTQTWETQENGASVRHTKKIEHMGKGVNNSLDFLRMMVLIISAEKVLAKKPFRLPGYKKLVEFMRVQGIPSVPDGAEERLRSFLAQFPKLRDRLMDESALTLEWFKTTSMVAGMQRRNAERVNNRSAMHRFMKKIGC